MNGRVSGKTHDDIAKSPEVMHKTSGLFVVFRSLRAAGRAAREGHFFCSVSLM